MASPKRRRFAVAAVVACTLWGACAQSDPTAPSTNPTGFPDATGLSGVTLTVRVLQRTTELPIAGARVTTSSGTGSTDASGLFVMAVAPGRSTDVDVSAPGYESMGASGVLADNERWTFYL